MAHRGVRELTQVIDVYSWCLVSLRRRLYDVDYLGLPGGTSRGGGKVTQGRDGRQSSVY